MTDQEWERIQQLCKRYQLRAYKYDSYITVYHKCDQHIINREQPVNLAYELIVKILGDRQPIQGESCYAEVNRHQI